MKLLYVFCGSVLLVALGVIQVAMPAMLSYAPEETFARLDAYISGGILIALGVASAVIRPADVGLRRTLITSAPTLGIVALSVYQLAACFALLYTRVGRFNTFWEMFLSIAVLVIALSVEHSRLSHMPVVPGEAPPTPKQMEAAEA